MYRFESRSTGGGTVALSSSVCRDAGQFRRIRSMSGRKPMSSMRSASSSTTTFKSAQRQRAAAHVVEHSTRRADDESRSALSFSIWLRIGLPP